MAHLSAVTARIGPEKTGEYMKTWKDLRTVRSIFAEAAATRSPIQLRTFQHECSRGCEVGTWAHDLFINPLPVPYNPSFDFSPLGIYVGQRPVGAKITTATHPGQRFFRAYIILGEATDAMKFRELAGLAASGLVTMARSARDDLPLSTASWCDARKRLPHASSNGELVWLDLLNDLACSGSHPMISAEIHRWGAARDGELAPQNFCLILNPNLFAASIFVLDMILEGKQAKPAARQTAKKAPHRPGLTAAELDAARSLWRKYEEWCEEKGFAPRTRGLRQVYCDATDTAPQKLEEARKRTYLNRG